MKVIYKTSMVDKINVEVYEAKLTGKEVDRIILTPDEWQDLKKEFKHYLYTVPTHLTTFTVWEGLLPSSKTFQYLFSS